MGVYGGTSVSFLDFNIQFSFTYLGHETCVELLLEQEVFQKIEGNAFSPLHCAVWVKADESHLVLLFTKCTIAGRVTTVLPYNRINDNEGAAEMLIDTLGASIVSATDSKGR